MIDTLILLTPSIITLGLMFTVWWVIHRRRNRARGGRITTAPRPRTPHTVSGPLGFGPYPVDRVKDGDTIVVSMPSGFINGDTLVEESVPVTVRVIGIDTPETVHPDKPVEFFGPEASAEAKRVLRNRHVYLIPDPTQAAVDQYGRVLAYVILDDGRDFGLHMLEHGFATEMTFRGTPRYERRPMYIEAQHAARLNGYGMWGVLR